MIHVDGSHTDLQQYALELGKLSNVQVVALFDCQRTELKNQNSYEVGIPIAGSVYIGFAAK